MTSPVPAPAFDTFRLGSVELANRIVMAPMTRSRAYGPGETPTELMATYYAQRAGLIITEGTQPSVVGQGYPDTPGLHSVAQVEAWRRVTDAVRAEGGVIFAQLMHTGCTGDPDLLPGDLTPVGPSAVAAAGQIYTHAGMKPFPVPRELTEDEIAETVADFATAARNAIAAGFDGVELHGANGYLIHQFLSSNANQRTDSWGGTVEGRIRFALEVAAAVVAEIGADRVGIRLSPGNPLHDIVEDDPHLTYKALLDGLADLGLVYVHVMESPGLRDLTQSLRAQWPGAFILNPATVPEPTGPNELALIEDSTAELVSFGGLFLATRICLPASRPAARSTPRTGRRRSVATTAATPTTRP